MTTAVAASDQDIVGEIHAVLKEKAKATDPVELARLVAVAFSRAFPSATPRDRLANALARGLTVRQRLMTEEGGSYSADEAAQLLGLSKAGLLKRYHNGTLLAWREEKQNAARFPAWQFEDGRVLPGLEQVLAALADDGRLDDAGRLLFFLSRNARLGNERPLDWLRKGKIEAVLIAARAYVE